VLVSRVTLTYAGLSYFDRTVALQTGECRPKGVALNFIEVDSVGEFFYRQARFAEFGAAEFSLSTHITLISQGDERFVGIPVFPSRTFRHSQVYVRTDADIDEPSDLAGRRIGILEYQMTAALWIRAFLQHDYGVTPDQLKWFTGGLRTPMFQERVDRDPPRGVSLERIPAGETLEGMLDRGELDGLVSAFPPSSFSGGGSRIRRLFPDFRAVEADYYRRTGFFPVMHTVVLRRDVYEERRWLARALLDAFNEAKERGLRRLRYTGSLAVVLPWLAAELEEVDGLFDGDPYPYGFARNREILEAATQYSYEQGLSDRKVDPAELFAPETLHEPMTI
jgi:4,5-dihydroxyphthalate decarboxylase